MSKNKIAKLLLALGIGVVTAASGVAIAGCNNTTDGTDDGTHQEQPKTEYTVQFNLNGGSGTAPASQTVESGEKLTPVAEPTHPDGLEFDGWYTAAEGGTKWNFETSTVTSNLTLYAHWKSNGTETNNPVLKLTPADVTSEEDAEILEVTIPAGEALVIDFDSAIVEGDYMLSSNPELYNGATVTVKVGTEEYEFSAEQNYAKISVASGVKSMTLTSDASEDLTMQLVIVSVSEIPGNPGGETEHVISYVDFTAAKNGYSGSGAYKAGKFTFEDGFGSFENNSSVGGDCAKLGGSGTISFSVVADTVLTFRAASGSSSGAGMYLYKVVNGNKTVVTTWGIDASGNGTILSGSGNDNFFGQDGNAAATLGDVTYTIEEEGDYQLVMKNTVRMSKLQVEEILEVSAQNGILVSAVEVENYLTGSTLNKNITVLATYENTSTRVLDSSKYEIVETGLDMNTKGVKEITVKYKGDEGSWTTTFEISVYEPKDVQLVTSVLNDKTASVYNKGDKFDASLISVNVVGECPEKDDVIFYNVDAKYYNLTLPATLDEGGVKELTVSLKDKAEATDTFTYYVIPELPAKTKEVTINVNGTLGEMTTKTIQQAIDYLRAMNLDESVIKHVKLAAEEYNEKVFIDVPNVVLEGAEGGKAVTENNQHTLTTKIWFDAINGGKDASGSLWANDAINNTNATVVVTAPNVTIKNVYIENYWNDADKIATVSGQTQALALFVWADMFTLDNCALSSYQDTVQFKTGRQLVVDSYIEGVTDFIYGTNATVYFYNSTIYSKWRNHNTQGGYITAFKGTNNSNGSDAVEYGAVFDNCYFTADERELEKGATAIARPWAAYSAVAIINSTLDKHISTAGYTDGTTHSQRYVGGLSTAKPTDETIKFYEYGNEGEGAITQEVAGMKMLTEEEVKAYKLFVNDSREISPDAKIFLASSNKNVGYTEDWMCVPVSNIMVTVVKKGASEAEDKELGKIVLYSGKSVTIATLSSLVPLSELTTGMTIDKFYTDRNCSVEYTGGALTSDTKIYYTEKEKPTVNDYEAFKVEQTGHEDKDAHVSANGVITDNTLFTLTSLENRLYHTGNSATAVSNSLKSFNLKDGSSFAPSFGSEGASMDAGASRDTLSVMAKEDVTVYLYVKLCNDSWNSDRSATWTYTIDGKSTNVSDTSGRANIFVLSIELKAGETAQISVTNNHASNTAYAWLFAADAELAK